MAKKEKSNEGTSIIPISSGAMSLGIGTVDPANAMERARASGTKMRPKVWSFKDPGQCVTGKLEGRGADVEMEDAAGETKRLTTWVLDVGDGIRIALMSSYQLDHELSELVGRLVRITYLAQVDTRKGQRVKDYLIEEFQDAEFSEEKSAG
jgi:hypothetical protein